MAKKNLVNFNINEEEKDFNIALDFLFDKKEGENLSVARLYPFSNENLSSMFKKLDMQGKKVLTVGSSGDQVLYSILNGAIDITLIDANPMTLPHLELKLAAIKNLGFEEFKKYISTGKIFDSKFYSKISHDLSEYSQRFWDTILINFNRYDLLLLEERMVQGNMYYNGEKEFSPIYNDPKAFEELKSKLNNVNINFIKARFNNFDKAIADKGQFDFIFLSNIADYVSEDTYTKQIIKLSEHLTDNGKIQLHYQFNKAQSNGLRKVKALSKHLGKKTKKAPVFIPELNTKSDLDTKGLDIWSLSYFDRKIKDVPVTIFASKDYFKEKKKFDVIGTIQNLLSSKDKEKTNEENEIEF